MCSATMRAIVSVGPPTANGTIRVIGFSGYSGGKLSDLVDVPFIARVDDMQKVEDMHMIIVHMAMQAVYGALHDGRNPSC